MVRTGIVRDLSWNWMWLKYELDVVGTEIRMGIRCGLNRNQM